MGDAQCPQRCADAVRGNGNIVGLGHRRDLQPLHQPAALGEVGLDDAQRLLFQERPEAIAGIDILARCDRHPRVGADAQHGFDIVGRHRLLHPEGTIFLNLVADLNAGLQVVMGVAFQPDLGVRSQLLAEAGKEIHHIVNLAVGHVQVVGAVRLIALADRPAVVGIIQPHLDGACPGLGENPFRDLRIGGMQIDRHAAAHLAAQQAMDRQAHRLAGQVPQRHLHARHRRQIWPALAMHEHHRRRAAQVDFVIAPEVRQDALDVQRIAALQHHIEIGVDDGFGADRIHALAGAVEALFGIDTHKAAVEAVPQADGADFADLQLGRAAGAGGFRIRQQRRIKTGANARADEGTPVHDFLPIFLGDFGASLAGSAALWKKRKTSH